MVKITNGWSFCNIKVWLSVYDTGIAFNPGTLGLEVTSLSPNFAIFSRASPSPPHLCTLHCQSLKETDAKFPYLFKPSCLICKVRKGQQQINNSMSGFLLSPRPIWISQVTFTTYFIFSKLLNPQRSHLWAQSHPHQQGTVKVYWEKESEHWALVLSHCKCGGIVIIIDGFPSARFSFPCIHRLVGLLVHSFIYSLVHLLGQYLVRACHALTRHSRQHLRMPLSLLEIFCEAEALKLGSRQTQKMWRMNAITCSCPSSTPREQIKPF